MAIPARSTLKVLAPIFLCLLALPGRTSGAAPHAVADILDTMLKQDALMHMPGDPWRNGPLTVQVGFKITKIIEFDLSQGVLTFSIWIRRRWLDERLYYNGTKAFGPNWKSNFDSLPLPQDSIWKPDLHLATAASLGEGETTSPKEIYLFDEKMARTEGWNVYWVEPITFSSKCKIDLKDFPFDIQECNLTFESWSYNDRMISLREGLAVGTDTEHLQTQEYAVSASNLSLEKSDYALTGRTYSGARFLVTFRRYPGYYMTNAIMPMLVMEVMACLTIWIPVDAGERLSYGITGLLTVMAIMLFLADRRPASATDTWLDLFQSECCLICFVPVAYSIFILWWQTTRANIIEILAAKGELQKERESSGEGSALYKYARSAIMDDWITPLGVDTFFRHCGPVIAIGGLVYQVTNVPNGYLISGSTGNTVLFAPCWGTLVVILAVNIIVVLRRYFVKGRYSPSEMDHIVGAMKVWVVDKTGWPADVANV